MRFYEFEDVLFKEYFDRNYNCETDPFGTLTFSFGNRHNDLNQYIHKPLMLNGHWENVIENVEIYTKFYISTKDNKEFDNHLEIPSSITKLINRDLGLSIKRDKAPPVAGMSFYTIVPSEKLPFNEVEVMRMSKFCEKFFNNSKLFLMSHYCVEAGKHKEKPNLHIHALILFRGRQNFSRELKTAWNKCYKESKYNIIYKEKGNCGIHRVPCNTLKIQQDKENYMCNDSKGSHVNFTDLGINQKFVF